MLYKSGVLLTGLDAPHSQEMASCNFIKSILVVLQRGKVRLKAIPPAYPLQAPSSWNVSFPPAGWPRQFQGQKTDADKPILASFASSTIDAPSASSFPLRVPPSWSRLLPNSAAPPHSARLLTGPRAPCVNTRKPQSARERQRTVF